MSLADKGLAMALGIFFVCDTCGWEIHSWDDGKPYYLDENGEKHYAHHPDPERDRCTGIDSPHLCLDCSATFMVDSNAPRADCPKCGSAKMSDTFDLEGKRCPNCKQGALARDPTRQDIS